jgi:hypothetical protein
MVYIDPKTFQCYATQNADATRIPDEEPLFNGKCQTFIEGYCCVPYGYTLTLPDGTAITGRQVFPWEDISELEEAQREYERQKLADAENALAIMWGGAV